MVMGSVVAEVEMVMVAEVVCGYVVIIIIINFIIHHHRIWVRSMVVFGWWCRVWYLDGGVDSDVWMMVFDEDPG